MQQSAGYNTQPQPVLCFRIETQDILFWMLLLTSVSGFNPQQQKRPLGSSTEPIGLGADLAFLEPSAWHQLTLRVPRLVVSEPRERASCCRIAELFLIFADPQAEST